MYPGMTLADYLTKHGLTHGQFAELIGCEQPTVTRFVGGKRIPSPELMRKIFSETGGDVTANDFFGIDPEEPGLPFEEEEAA